MLSVLVVVFMAMLLWQVTPLLSMQLLWINLVTDSLPAIALGMEPVEEGIMEVDRYIDQCLRLGLGELTVIHGKGTGVLRKGLHEHLRKSRFVKSFRLGVYGEGENGVTILTLK